MTSIARRLVTSKLVLGTAAATTLGLYALAKATPEVPTVPKNSLLAVDRATPYFADVFQMTLTLPKNSEHHLLDGTAHVSIDAYASAFERCWAFHGLRKLLFATGSAEPGRFDATQPLPAVGRQAKLTLGQPVSAFWTVTGIVHRGRNEGGEEVILTFDDALGVGSTWLKVDPVQDPTNANNKVRLMLGSSLDSSKTGKQVLEMPWIVIELHRVYSRILLANAAGQLWWDLYRDS